MTRVHEKYTYLLTYLLKYRDHPAVSINPHHTLWDLSLRLALWPGSISTVHLVFFFLVEQTIRIFTDVRIHTQASELSEQSLTSPSTHRGL